MQSGDRIRVIGGPYQGWQGEILKVNDEQHVTVLIPVFAKATAHFGHRDHSDRAIVISEIGRS